MCQILLNKKSIGSERESSIEMSDMFGFAITEAQIISEQDEKIGNTLLLLLLQCSYQRRDFAVIIAIGGWYSYLFVVVVVVVVAQQQQQVSIEHY